MSWTLMSSKFRKAAHGLHRCEWCRRPIAARSEYLDNRIAEDGTAYTQRSHVQCDRLIGQAMSYFSLDGEDMGDPEETVSEMQRELGLPVGWPEVPS